MNTWLTLEFWQELGRGSVEWAVRVLPAIVLILIIALVASFLIRKVIGRASNLIATNLKRGGRIAPDELDKRVATLTGILNASIGLVFWLVVFMMILRRLGLDVAPIIAGAGILGLAVGFGAQNLVQDFIAGFFILMENQVRAGDVAIINGTGGMVEQVGLRTIVLRDVSGVVHVVQNGKINTLSNMTKEWSAIVFDIGVAYKEDTDKVVAVMERVAAELRNDETLGPDITDDLEVFGVDAFGDSAVVIKARLKTKPIRQWAVGREYRRRLKYAFDREGIEIPFPHRTLYWGKEE
ncbi:MAG: mechanosensitive ion channel family protein [Spirochaeta sp.]|jgi:small-conductance mechanosensitive channel|nr:mechanosensitive ion channel family protein [Spirochaeta sp.]